MIGNVGDTSSSSRSELRDRAQGCNRGRVAGAATALSSALGGRPYEHPRAVGGLRPHRAEEASRQGKGAEEAARQGKGLAGGLFFLADVGHLRPRQAHEIACLQPHRSFVRACFDDDRVAPG